MVIIFFYVWKYNNWIGGYAFNFFNSIINIYFPLIMRHANEWLINSNYRYSIF